MSEPDLSSLNRHFALPDSERPVAYRGGVPISRATFHRNIDAARRTLAQLVPGEVEGRPGIALFDPDAYRFAVWLLAAWSLGLAVALPGDDLAATRESLTMPWIGAAAPGNALSQWHDDAPPTSVDYGTPVAFAFTSGSTGKPSLIEKGVPQLRAEAAMFEQAFGAGLTPETRFVASVPHQHMYGMPFFMMWTLVCAHPFVVEKVRYPEDLGRLPEGDYVLISAPTFLKHLKDAPPPPNGVRWWMATSAGSPLALDVARAGIAYMGAPLYEIYGSTETGAVAHRVGDAHWHAMPGVRLSLQEGTSRLTIHSPLLTGAEFRDGFLSGDVARIDKDGLKLLGRVDRVVKIGEKRISLTQVEQELARLPEVESARVLALPHERVDERVVLGAVVVLSEAGRNFQSTEKKTRLNARLRDQLRERLEPLALPRRWRYVTAFPLNDMGKTTRADLDRLFAPEFPHVEEIPGTLAEDKVALALKVPRDLAWFEGHFPDLQVLPGVAQLDWAAHFGQLYFGFDASAADVSNLKFQNLIRPSSSPRLDLTLRRDGAELEFVYSIDGKSCACGVFVPRKAVAGGGAPA
jgi:acyl-CoA synthetase (AMP-forming)/AMP-acid ligase II